MSSAEQNVPRFDVAITFAGEDRTIAEKIRRGLLDKGLRVFYDEDFKAEMWGKNLVDFLHRVYSREASYALMLISKSYVEKHWTNHERQAAQERALTESREYILPVKLDDTDVPGLPSTIFYLDARVEGVTGITEALAEKVRVGSADPGALAPTVYTADVPSEPEEFSDLLVVRPPAWEYLLFAGRLREELASRKSEYFDFQMKYTPKAGPRLDWSDGFRFISDAGERFGHTAEQVEIVLNPEIQEAAFGAPGDPGDPGRISHLASRIAALYVALMDNAAELRAAVLPGEHLTRAARLMADCAIQPVEAIRKLSDDLCEQLTDIHTRLEAGEDIKIELPLVFDIPDEMSKAMHAEIEAARDEAVANG